MINEFNLVPVVIKLLKLHSLVALVSVSKLREEEVLEDVLESLSEGGRRSLARPRPFDQG